MDEPTSRDIAKTLFLPSADLRQRIDTLTTVVMDLMMEVEALRETLAAKTDYREAYRGTGLLTHDSTGPSMGWDKLLDRYYPRNRNERGRAWREALMLHRLGFSTSDIEAYRRDAEGMEVRT